MIKKTYPQHHQRENQELRNLCAHSQECGPVNVLKEHVKKLAEETAVLKQELADRDSRLEEMEARLRNLQGDLFSPSSERIQLATKDGIVVEGG